MRFSHLSKSVLFALCFLLGGVACGQNDGAVAGASPYVLRIHKYDAKIHLDGNLDETVWQTIQPISKLVQTTPVEGGAASQRTEARIFYDDNNLYLGFKCFDDPKKVVRRLASHDGMTGSDSMDMLFDTFGDRRTAYWFSLTAAGVQFDGVYNESTASGGFEAMDMSWDGIWYSAVAMHDWGWSAEIILPFKSIRVSRDSRQWGFNFGREITRNNEFDYWVPVPRFEQVMKPSRAGTLVGMEDIRVGRNLELVPFTSFNYRNAGGQPELRGPSGNGGVDARYGLSQNLTLNLTVNPDFADTEADELTSQISRYEIFFPEKRKFFTEGANYFTTPLELAFSRRIGSRLPNGEPQRILEGGKITGKAGPWTIGALQAVTQGTDYIDPTTGLQGTAPGAFFGVVRVQHDLLRNSAFGFTSVNRRQSAGTYGESESSHAVDLSILSGSHLRWNSQVGVNTNDTYRGLDGQHMMAISDFTYQSDQFDTEAATKFMGRNTNLSYTGFEPETDRMGGEINGTWKPFINRYGVRQLFFHLNYDENNGTRGELEDSGADAQFKAEFKNFWTATLHGSYERTRFYDFAPNFTPLATTRLYRYPRWLAELSTNQNRAFSVDATYTQGKLVQYDESFYGHHKTLTATSHARFGRHLRLDLSGAYIREYLSSGVHYQNRRFLISRWNYQFTQKLRTRVLAQYSGDRHGHNLSLNSLVAYDFTARSAFYIGYNRQNHRPLDPSDLGNQVFVKMSYLFGF